MQVLLIRLRWGVIASLASTLALADLKADAEAERIFMHSLYHFNS